MPTLLVFSSKHNMLKYTATDMAVESLSCLFYGGTFWTLHCFHLHNRHIKYFKRKIDFSMLTPRPERWRGVVTGKLVCYKQTPPPPTPPRCLGLGSKCWIRVKGVDVGGVGGVRCGRGIWVEQRA